MPSSSSAVSYTHLRDVLLGSAGAVGAATFPFPKPAIAQSDPIKIGFLAAMTGPSSAPTIGFNRGVIFEVDAINATGGVKDVYKRQM